ncbi:MAG: hypothetical protein MI747_25360 [Desulfobacterales bacterium]|nr:hypothetical protein [Desulfobacterales bacterium]
MRHDLSAETLNQWITQGRDTRFLVVDIRKKKDYEREHIPGAVHIPIMEVETHPSICGAGERDLVFYCHYGKRSKAAVLFAADAGHPMERLHHLKGGIFSYTGEVLMDPPNLDHFPMDDPLEKHMEMALEFEKAAFLFYGKILPLYKGTKAEPLLRQIAGVEIAHGKSIFSYLNVLYPQSCSFEEYFETLSGEILEGGTSMEKIDEFLLNAKSDKYLDVLDFAYEIEVGAYDLYRIMAEKSVEPSLRKMFFVLAQDEKTHVKMVSKIQAMGL